MQLRRPVLCFYDGHPRLLSPVVLGHSDGEEMALAFQSAGGSNTGLPPGGEYRCLHLAKASHAELSEGAWVPGTRPTQHQHCVDDVDLDADQSGRRRR